MGDQGLLGGIEVFQILKMRLDRLTDVKGRGAPGPRGKGLQTGIGFIRQADRSLLAQRLCPLRYVYFI